MSMRIVLTHLEACGSATVEEVAAATGTSVHSIRKAMQNLSHRKRVRSVGTVKRPPGHRGALSHRWVIQAEVPASQIVRRAIATQHPLATVWARTPNPVTEGASA